MNARTVLSPAERDALLLAPTLSASQAAAALGVGATALKAAIRRGDIDLTVIPVGARRVIATASLLRLLGMEGFESVDRAISQTEEGA
jgi:hypothetical protein